MMLLLACTLLTQPLGQDEKAKPEPGWAERVRRKAYRFIGDQVKKFSDDEKREIVRVLLDVFDALPEDSRNDIAKKMQAQILKSLAPKKK